MSRKGMTPEGSLQLARDTEVGARQLGGGAGHVVRWTAIAMSVFQLRAGIFGEIPGTSAAWAIIAFLFVNPGNVNIGSFHLNEDIANAISLIGLASLHFWRNARRGARKPLWPAHGPWA